MRHALQPQEKGDQASVKPVQWGMVNFFDGTGHEHDRFTFSSGPVFEPQQTNNLKA